MRAPGATPTAVGNADSVESFDDLFSPRRHTTLIPVPLALPWRRRLGLFLGVFVLYLLAGTREPPWSDAKMVHGVAEAIVERGTVAIAGGGIPYAGKSYGLHPLLPSLVHVPGAWLHHKITKAWPSARARSKAFTSHLGSAFVGALAVLLFVQLCLELGTSAEVAGLGGLTLALGTMLAIWARVAWTEIVQVACFLGFFRALLRTAATPTRALALALGAWAGALVNTKLVFLTCLPGAAALAGVRIWRMYGPTTVARTAGWALVGGLPFVVMLFGYNLARGGFFNVGYAVAGAAGENRAFGESLLFGLHGLFFSLGKSVFLYNPPLIVALLALPLVLRDGRFGRDWLWAAVLTAAPPLAIYGRLVFWSGDWAWGPRYLIYLVPVLLLPGVLALQILRDQGSRLRAQVALAMAALTLAAGLFVQVLGGAFYWDHFIRMSQAAQHHWLGIPNRAGAVSAVRPDGRCDPCFEDFLTFNHLPAFQPIEGHLWLARHKLNRDPWSVAELDAPWRRYTTLALPLSRQYGGARADWWALDYAGPRPRRAAYGIVAAGLLLLGLSIWLWREKRVVGVGRAARGRGRIPGGRRRKIAINT